MIINLLDRSNQFVKYNCRNQFFYSKDMIANLLVGNPAKLLRKISKIKTSNSIMKYFSAFLLFLLLSFVSSCKEYSNQSENTDEGSLTTEKTDQPQTAPPGWPWRGITIVSHVNREEVTEKSIEELAEMGVNLVRLRLDFPKFAKKNKVDIEQSIQSTVSWSKQVIEWCDKYGILVLISYTNFPIVDNQNYNQTSSKFWNSQNDLDKALEGIEMLVKTFDNFPNVVAYEFIAEPVLKTLTGSISPPQWNNFFQRIINAVRGVSNKYLLYTPGPWGGPDGYDNMGEKFDDPKIIYNFHFYLPHLYTHQGTERNKEQSTYPGKIRSVYWDKEQLEEKVKIIMDWAKKENVKYLFAGEFSAVKWAEGKDQYLSDLLSVFEKYDIGWAYFSFNGWEGWSYTQKIDFEAAQRTTEQKSLYKNTNETQKLLKSFWAKNK